MTEKKEINRRAVLLGISTVAATTIANLPNSAIAALGSDITHGPRSIKKVALTFHGAGDQAIAKELFNIFEAHNAPLNIFAVGNWIAENKDLATRAISNGYDIGNHTYTHLAMKTLGAAKVKSEIEKCANVLTKEIGYGGKWFRPSGTQYSNALIRKTARSFGYKQCISYDVDSLDYTDPGAKAVVENVKRQVKNGSIISLHFGHKNTVEAAPQILTDLKAAGLTPVTLTQLLAPLGVFGANRKF
jgi:peptidoglycan/xylan/chitin deacetylase (PgdA/CDA1 family)